MEDQTCEASSAFAGSNLQLCFVNEHHQANDALDHDTVRKAILLTLSYFIFLKNKDVGRSQNQFEKFSGRGRRYSHQTKTIEGTSEGNRFVNDCWVV